DAKSTTRTKSFRLRGLTFEKINPEVLFYGASGRIFMLFGVLPDSNNCENIKDYCCLFYRIAIVFNV
ncbi:MAG: hypothetical protein SPH03_07500, partial [Prevotella sp.]|nr:hypothetical protein [Prevotella sp.]